MIFSKYSHLCPLKTWHYCGIAFTYSLLLFVDRLVMQNQTLLKSKFRSWNTRIKGFWCYFFPMNVLFHDL